MTWHMYTLPQVTCVQVKKWLNISKQARENLFPEATAPISAIILLHGIGEAFLYHLANVDLCAKELLPSIGTNNNQAGGCTV